MAVHHDRAFDDLRNTVHEYARILRRRWRLTLLVASIVSSVAFWVSQYLPRQYSTATLFERRDDVVLRNLVHRNSPYSFDQLKSSMVLDMTGSRALAAAATRIGLLADGEITSEQALTKEERRRLDAVLAKYDLSASVRLVHSSPSLDTIELRCQANDPRTAWRFVVALRDGYIRRTRERMTEILSSARDFFANEVERYQRRANEADQRLKDQFADFPGVDPGNPASAGARLEALQADRVRLAQRKAEIMAQIAARERFLTSSALTEPTGTPPGSAPVAPPALPETESSIQEAIDNLEQQVADAIVLKRMTNEHPAVKAIQRKLDNLYAARDAALRPPPTATSQPDSPAQRLRLVDPVLAGQRLRVELELDALRSQLEIANEHLTKAEERVATFTSLYDRLLKTSDQVQKLEGELAQDAATASVWRQHLGQLERILAAESEQRGTQFALVEEPKENAHAIRPQAAAVFLVSLGCGLAAAALLTALVELLDRSFASAGQVTRTLGLPILECIGVINTPRVRRRRLLSRMVWTPALCVLLGAVFLTASLAYTSLEHPGLHHRAISRLDAVLHKIGAPRTSLGDKSE